MKTILISSTGPLSGKSSIILGLGAILKERGYNVGYMKPVGNRLKHINGKTIDEDADNLREMLGITATLEDINPIHASDDFLQKVLAGEVCGLENSIGSAFERISAGKDVVLLEGNTAFSAGSAYQMTDLDIAHILGASIVLVVRYGSLGDIDGILNAYRIAGDPGMIMGVILNDVPVDGMEDIALVVRPYLTRLDIDVLGVVPRDGILRSSSVEEIARTLEGRVLTAGDRIEELVEYVLVGAMEADSASVFFKRAHDYAVVTGGDRADIQLSALDAGAKCLILTGNLFPSAAVLGSAEKKHVPVILVPTDSMSAILNLEKIKARSSINHPAKHKRIVELLSTEIEIDKFTG